MKLSGMRLTRLVSLLAAACIALAMLFGLNSAWQNWQTASQSRVSAELVDFSVSVSDLVHEIQKERGASAVFLTSQGRSFVSEVQEQRKATDAELNVVRDRLDELQTQAHSSAVVQSLSDLETQLNEIDDLRSQVDALAINRSQQVSRYTKVNRTAIALVGSIGSGVSEPEVAKQLLVYSALLYGKDNAGIARAIGASGFGAGQFNRALSTKLIGLTSAQESYFDYVSQLALPAQKNALTKILESEENKNIAAMREIALSGNADAIAAISASDWFDTKTAMIGELKALEDLMAADMKKLMLDALSNANTNLMIAGVLLLSGLLFAAWLVRVCVRLIDRRVRSIVAPLERLSNGDADVTIPDHSHNEFGVISKAMEAFQSTIEERARNAKDRERVVTVLSQHLKAMAQGNLNDSISEFFSVEFKKIRMDFNEAQSSLRDVINAVAQGTAGINYSAQDVKSAAVDLSERAARQAATLEETTEALAQTNAGIQSSAELAQATNQEVARARENAAQNREVVERTITAMKQIQGSFDEVTKITDLIEDIAFQTNILALNAGVEATRAGEAGKGFGVVASEVRALAQRSSEAVTSIQQLMGEGADKIRDGAEQVAASGDALKTMITTFDQVSDQVSQIASASGEQAENLNNINIALADLKGDTHSNAAMAEESSAASELLNVEVQRLNERTAMFRQSAETVGDFDEPDQLRLAS
ncbi:MAG: nitrate- and nitrite sensing domain-containing protein [Pseudomonadota bacterium]